MYVDGRLDKMIAKRLVYIVCAPCRNLRLQEAAGAFYGSLTQGLQGVPITG